MSLSDERLDDGRDAAGESRQEREARVQARRARTALDWMLSASAGIVALCALAVSIYQTYLVREQAKMSAWPYVTMGNRQDDGDTASYAFVVANEGVGPALVRSVEVLADEKPAATWGAVARAFEAPLAQAERSYYSSFHRGSVLLAGARRDLVSIRGSTANTFWRAAQTRFRMRICYCSLYDDCWIADSEAEQPREVRACTQLPGDSVWRQ